MGRKKKTAEDYNREYVGKVYGYSRIDEYTYSKNNNPYFLCTCLRCGVKFGPVILQNLKSGRTTSCGKCVINNPEKYYQEYIGKRYGHYVIREYHHMDENGKAYFLCDCDCGNDGVVVRLDNLKSGNTTSCGHCLERTEIGKRYGHYVVREYHHRDEKGELYFICDCDCGNDGVVVRLRNLKSGNTTSCGHCSERTEIGKRYGHYVVREYHHRDEYGIAYFLCDCDCGNDGIVVRLDSLKSGHTTSCGCITESIGETNIKNILDENNISYESQKRFEDCKNINTLPFDFYITHNGLEWCVEFDGPQHEKVVEVYGGEEKFKQTQQNDQIKNQYCKDNGIPLIRIPYHKRDTMTIDDLMLGSNYLLI